jgi:hypothetical protein
MTGLHCPGCREPGNYTGEHRPDHLQPAVVHEEIRPPVSYTNHLKTQQLAASHAVDKTPAHYEEDHLVSLELGGHRRDPRNLWPERWGTPGHPLRRKAYSRRTSSGPRPRTRPSARSTPKSATALTPRGAQFINATDWFKYYRETVLK